MRTSLKFLALIGFCAASAKLWAPLWPLWLDSPGYRSNANDPKSPLYREPAPIPPAPTRTSTISPTFTASPPSTPTVTATNSPTSTDTPSSTVTPTNSPSPSNSPTPTLSPAVYYDGDTGGATLDGLNRAAWTVTPGATYLMSAAETSNGGAHSGSFLARVNLRTLGYPILAGVGNTSGASVDVGAYNAISLWLRSTDGCFEPAVMIHSPGSVVLGSSVMVTATTYTDGAFDAGVWRHVVIPLAAFDGKNAWGNAFSLSGNANRVDAVMVSPSFPRNYHYFAAGPFWVFRDIFPASYNQDTMDMDDVQFQAISSPVLKLHSTVFDAFISPDGMTQWDTSWSVAIDGLSCMPPNSAISYPAAGVAPVDNASAPTNACYAGHFAGTLGAASGAAPCLLTETAFAAMTANFQVGGGPLSLTTLPELALTAGQIKGISFYLKLGPTSAAIDYDMVIRKASVAALNDKAHYLHRVPASMLSSAVWNQITVNFPAAGLMGTDIFGSFGQPPWAAGAGASVPWDTRDLLQIQVMPADTARGQKFDIFVGQIKFY